MAYGLPGEGRRAARRGARQGGRAAGRAARRGEQPPRRGGVPVRQFVARGERVVAGGSAPKAERPKVDPAAAAAFEQPDPASDTVLMAEPVVTEQPAAKVRTTPKVKPASTKPASTKPAATKRPRSGA
ncbi:hypothetical protein ACFQX7_25480 [Luedemannella flava]